MAAGATGFADGRAAGFWRAGGLMLIGMALSFFGFIHAGSLSPAGGTYEIGWNSGPTWAAGYAMCAAFFALTGLWVRASGQDASP